MTLDKRVIFYLEHRRYIDEWASLAQRIPDEANRFFSSLVGPIDELARELAPAPQLFHTLEDDGETYPKIFLHRPTWKKEDSAEPSVAVGFEWVRKSTTFETGYVGLWVNRDADGGETLWSRLRELVRGDSGLSEYKVGNASSYWPAWKYIAAAKTDYWCDLAAFQAEIVEHVRGGWRDLAEIADTGLRECSPQD